MKKILALVVAVGIGFAAGYLLVARHLGAEHESSVAHLQSAWQNERATLEQEIELAKARAASTVTNYSALAPTMAQASRAQTRTPAEIIESLRTFKNVRADQTFTLRRILHELEDLVLTGPPALPAIKEFLKTEENGTFFLTPEQRSGPTIPGNFFPRTMRLGLLEAAKRIGGADAESILADTLARTSRSEEITWLALSLKEMEPDKYRDLATSAARRLINTPATPDRKNGDRDLGFLLLTEFRDTSYVADAQQQIVRADGQVDTAALKYLQRTLGQQVLPIVSQLYDDPRIADAQRKEPLARVALNYVGADAQANEFYVKAINDAKLSNEQRKNLIEDLNQDGFANRKNLSANDLPLINNRMALIEQLVPSTTDPVNLAAMKEAYKDLVKMRERATKPPPAP